LIVSWFNGYTGDLKSERNNREFTVAITSAREAMKPDYPGRYAAAVNFAAAYGTEARPGSLAKSLRAAKSGRQ
jgi:hypothetical protein